MFVHLDLKSDRHPYTYENVNLFDIGTHKFPSGKLRKCLTLFLGNGDTINFAFSDVADFVVENYKGEKHPRNDDAKIIFVEDGQSYEWR